MVGKEKKDGVNFLATRVQVADDDNLKKLG